MSKQAFFWFRRDLRGYDNAGLYHALKNNDSVRTVFIFDATLLKNLSAKKDRRLLFIHQTLQQLQHDLRQAGGELEVYHGDPQQVWKELLQESLQKNSVNSKNHSVSLYFNHDYEPKARKRDQQISELCEKLGVECHSSKDQVIFEKSEVLNGSDLPYTVFTPYKKKWLQMLSPFYVKPYPVKKYLKSLAKPLKKVAIPTLKELGFESDQFQFPSSKVIHKTLAEYAATRDLPALNATTRLGLHLRFGTLSIRELVPVAKKHSAIWLSELIWREFFMQILFHFPQVETSSFRPVYDTIAWRKSPKDLKRWQEGKTGYPLVDAGMRELNATGFMHNRARMVTASFLTKHLLIHWREGEKYFAEKLLDYDLAANNGNWQWAAGSGCDAAPYFRVFNPETQRIKFDKNEEYVRKWVPEYGTPEYPEPMVDHGFARMRALREYQTALKPGASKKPSPILKDV